MPLPRDRQPEWMDDPALAPAEHRRALAGLARLNRLSSSAGAFWPHLRRLARRHPERPLRVLDVATGGGDTPIKLARLAAKSGVRLELAACDISDTALALAEESAGRAGVSVRWFRHDALAGPPPGEFDAAICSLFLHHLDPPEARELLGNLRASAPVVLVNDLARGRFNLGLVWLACRLVSRSPVVHFDGPASVRGSYTAAEARELAADAGLPGARARTLFPCRFLMTWERE